MNDQRNLLVIVDLNETSERRAMLNFKSDFVFMRRFVTGVMLISRGSVCIFSLIVILLFPTFSSGQVNGSSADSILQVVQGLPTNKDKALALINFIKSSGAEPVVKEQLAGVSVHYAEQTDDPALVARAKIQLAYAIFRGKTQRYDSASAIANEVIKIAKEYNLPDETFEALHLNGVILKLNDKHLEALRLQEECLEIGRTLNNPSYIARAELELATIYSDKGLPLVALRYAKKAYEQQKDNPKSVFTLAYCYDGAQELDSALHYYKISARLRHLVRDYAAEGICYLNIAGIYKRMNDYDRAIAQTRFNLTFAQQYELSNIEASAVSTVALQKMSSLEFDTAITCFKRANQLWEQLGFTNSSMQVDNARNIGICYFKSNKIDSAVTTLTRIHAMAFHNISLTKSILLELAQVYQYKKDYKSAHACLVNVLTLTDSLEAERRSEELANAEFRLGIENIAREKDMLITQQALDKELINKTKQGQYVLGAAVAILVPILLALGFQIYSKQRLNTKLIVKNDLIEKQKEELQLSLAANIKVKEELSQNNAALTEAIEKMKSLQGKLIESEKMASLGQLTAGIAHEINNPINFISGAIQGLSSLHKYLLDDGKKLSDEELGELRVDIDSLMKTIDVGVSRTVAIVNSLRNFSGGDDSINPNTVCDIKTAVESSLIILNSKIKSSEVELVTLFNHQSLVRIDESKIGQIVINLVDNALDALGTSVGMKRIVITTEETDGYVLLRIRDNGKGIPPAVQKKILEPFFTTKETGKGTGLGLSISYGIVRKHNGTLTFTSNPGEGTEFIVTLPKSV